MLYKDGTGWAIEKYSCRERPSNYGSDMEYCSILPLLVVNNEHIHRLISYVF